MSNPFDQFTSDFQAALPPTEPVFQSHLAVGPQTGYPPQNQQQQGFPPGPYTAQQPPYGSSVYENQHPGPASLHSNPYEQFASPSVGTYNAAPPQQAAPSLSYAEIPAADMGNPFAAPGYDFNPPPSSSFTNPPPSSSYTNPPPSSSYTNPPPSSSFVNPGNPYAQPNADLQQGNFVPPPFPTGQPSMAETSFGQMPPIAPSTSYSDPWGAPAPSSNLPPNLGVGGQAPPPHHDPNAGALVPSLQPSNPYAQQSNQLYDASAGALVPAQQQSNPYAQSQSFGQPANAFAADSYGNPQSQQDGYGQGYGMPPQQDPYGQHQGYGQQPGYGASMGYEQPSQYGQQVAYGQAYPPPPQQYQPPPPADPFSVFESQARAIEPGTQSAAMVPYSAPNPTASDDDFWGGFGPPTTEAPAPAPVAPSPPEDVVETKPNKVEEEKKGDDGLPPGGEWYDARIFTPTLGVMFFKPQELTDSLFLNTSRDIVDSLGERPVVAFIVEGSSARAAGVELGHVLLKVNGADVRSPKEASRLIKEGPRPLPLLFYVPNTEVVTAEGEHMVKYDTRETTAPNSAKDWKPKYVVIGGIIAQPWMMNMYRSKSEYDIAVIETQARRPVSVKVKQFSLQGARIQNDWQGPQMVKYKNKTHPWKYIVVLPVARNPIKISSPNLSQLKPVHEGIRRVLLAQQRAPGGANASSKPMFKGAYEGPTTGPAPGQAYNGYSTQNERGYAPQQAEAQRY